MHQATLQRVLILVLAVLIYKSSTFYLDNIVVALPTFEQHLIELEEVLARLKSASLSLKLSVLECPIDLPWLESPFASSAQTQIN